MMGEPAKYYEDHLAKKEGKGKWVDYWVIIRGCWMLFYASKDVTDRNNFRGSLELSKNTKYSVSKRRGYSFPFYVTTPRGTHLFKCESNLKRHQWMYVLGLAIKCYPPLPPPSFVPRVTVKDDEGNYLASWDTDKECEKTNNSQLNRDDSLDDEDDDDDTSLPPGVILVSTLPDDLTSSTDGENEREKLLNSINKTNQEEEIVIPSNAVLSTGITGTTSVVNKKSKNDAVSSRSNQFYLSGPLPRTVSKSTGSIRQESSRSPNILSSSSWLEARPSTSPFSSTTYRSPWSGSASGPGNSTPVMNNLKFSRHMTNSAPDVKVVGFED